MTAGRRTNNVPVPRTVFIGRARELASLKALMAEPGVRLATIIGPGGVGKTRLAIEYANWRAVASASEVVFVPLAEFRETALAIAAIQDALSPERRLPLEEHQPALRTPVSSGLTLILDNFEQVIEAAPAVAALLDAHPGLHIVATSRAPLRISGERECALEPFAVSAGGETLEARAASSEAVDLFVDRARAVIPGFTRTARNADDLDAICRMLDGLPLAIELAAARVKVLAPAALRARLERSPLDPGPGLRDAPLRQRTLASAIDWSYRLLSPAEQRLMQELSVFVGGFSLEAAEAVLRPSGELAALDGVAALVDHSLVRSLSGGDAEQFVMLGAIRAFATERATELGDLENLRNRHAAYFSDLVERVEGSLLAERSPDADGRILAELDNIRAALVWLWDQERYDDLARLASRVARYWLDRGLLSEAKLWLERVQNHDENVEPGVRLRTYTILSFVASFQGDHNLAIERGRIALALAEELGDPQLQINVLNAHAGAALYRGDVAMAIDLWEDVVARATLVRTGALSYGLMHNLALAHVYGGSLSRAAEVQVQSEEFARKALDPIRAERAAMLGVEIDLARGDVPAGQNRFARILAAIGRDADDLTLLELASVAASLAFFLGRLDITATLTGAIDAARDRFGFALPQPEVTADEVRRTRLRASLGNEGVERALAEGAQLDRAGIYGVIETLRMEPVALRQHQHGLTAHEFDVLRLLGSGETNHEIAVRLFISPRTVQSHVANILAKLGASTRAAAVSLAAQEGLV